MRKPLAVFPEKPIGLLMFLVQNLKNTLPDICWAFAVSYIILSVNYKVGLFLLDARLVTKNALPI